MFQEVASLLNSREEQTVIINGITQENNNVLVEKSNATVKFHKMDRSMEEAVSKFQSVVEAEKWNDGPQQKIPLAENEKTDSRSNQEQGMDKSTERRKGVKRQPIVMGVDSGAEACKKNSTETGVMRTGKKVYRPPLTSTYKEKELSEDLNNGME